MLDCCICDCCAKGVDPFVIGDRRQYVHQVGNLHISCWGKGATCGEKTHELQVVSKCPQDLFIEAEKHANSRIMAPYREQSIEDRVTKDKKQREVSSPKTFENDKLNDFLLPASAEYVNVDCDNPDRQDLQISEDEDKDEDDRVPPTRLESEGPPTQPASQTAKQ